MNTESFTLNERAAAWSAHFRPLVLVERGGLIEAVHSGAVVAVHPDGGVIGAAGAPDAVIYLRSAAKPLQVLPLVMSGAADHFGFTPRELAVMAGSHDGSEAHVETVAGTLQRSGLDESALACGADAPLSRRAAIALQLRGELPRPIHNNCSGKHAAMLALARYRGYPLDNYYRADHPAQREIIAALAELAGWPAAEIIIGVDGCGVPVFGLPLWASARAFARLANPAGLPAALGAACRRVVAAMQTYPEMVAGAGRICTVLLTVFAGQVVAKGGAEGFYALGILPGILPAHLDGVGLVVKIAEGESRRGLSATVIEALRQLGLAGAPALARFERHFPSEVRNHRGELVGSIRAVFELA